MVRIDRKLKPIITDGRLVAQRSGRFSRAWMDGLVSFLTNTCSDVAQLIHTANAGEHAISTALALSLNFTTGLMDGFERSGIVPVSPAGTPPGSPPRLSCASYPFMSDVGTHIPELLDNTKILQIETSNPHVHSFSKGDEHIQNMQIARSWALNLPPTR